MYRVKFTHEEAVTAVVVSYYWHFVDVVWIALFATSTSSSRPGHPPEPLSQTGRTSPVRATLRSTLGLTTQQVRLRRWSLLLGAAHPRAPFYNVTAYRARSGPRAHEADYDDDTRRRSACGGSSWSAAPPATARTARASRPRTAASTGPSLVGVGAAAVDFQARHRPHADGVNPAAQAPQKEKVYNDEEIEKPSAYVASLGPGPAIPESEVPTTRTRSPRTSAPRPSCAAAGASAPTHVLATTSLAAGGASSGRAPRPQPHRRGAEVRRPRC